MKWIDCGICGSTHQYVSGADCRAFRTCQKCGDCYHNQTPHYCLGVTMSEQPDAEFVDEDEL